LSTEGRGLRRNPVNVFRARVCPGRELRAASVRAYRVRAKLWSRKRKAPQALDDESGQGHPDTEQHSHRSRQFSC